MRRRVMELVFGSFPARALTRIIMAGGRSLDRIASYARARALFPDAPDLVCHWSAEIKYPENITIGHRVIIAPHSVVGAKAPVFLGDGVHFSKGVIVETGTADISTIPFTSTSAPIRIERGVWLGARSMVLAGVTIGENSIIAAGTIVRKSVPANSFVTTERARVQSFVQPGSDDGKPPAAG